jgi:hypothetical protein
MRRESYKWGDPVRANTDAPGRGGAARSSEEAPVMGVERRGRVIQSVLVGQPEMG